MDQDHKLLDIFYGKKSKVIGIIDIFHLKGTRFEMRQHFEWWMDFYKLSEFWKSMRAPWRNEAAIWAMDKSIGIVKKMHTFMLTFIPPVEVVAAVCNSYLLLVFLLSYLLLVNVHSVILEYNELCGRLCLLIPWLMYE